MIRTTFHAAAHWGAHALLAFSRRPMRRGRARRAALMRRAAEKLFTLGKGAA
ncbi:hypothetical protein [Chachezhania sediminis]|uniref:hypothetical protein n=1 Tax=Chachezhania sediminis TaxID=2599291 RepID=UPI00131CC8CF|nr:hypothetical protein [Chachezhania sediminis]